MGENRRTKNHNIMIFVDLEEAYDIVQLLRDYI